MTLKIRIETATGKEVSTFSTLEELLDVLVEAELGVINLSVEEDDSLRGWILMKAEELEPGKALVDYKSTKVAAGKTKDGRTFVRDHRGEWPPPKPIFE